jgi:hypothetical protein
VIARADLKDAPLPIGQLQASPPSEGALAAHGEGLAREGEPGLSHGPARLAIGLDDHGRQFFVSLDGDRFRQVPHFPVGPDRAEILFRRAESVERDEVELIAKFAGKVAFMLVPR